MDEWNDEFGDDTMDPALVLRWAGRILPTVAAPEHRCGNDSTCRTHLSMRFTGRDTTWPKRLQFVKEFFAVNLDTQPFPLLAPTARSVLDGTYDFPPDMDNTTRELFEEIVHIRSKVPLDSVNGLIKQECWQQPSPVYTLVII